MKEARAKQTRQHNKINPYRKEGERKKHIRKLHKRASTTTKPKIILKAVRAGKESDMTKYEIITEDGKKIFESETYRGCENYWNACNGIYEDENGEHYIYIRSVC